MIRIWSTIQSNNKVLIWYQEDAINHWNLICFLVCHHIYSAYNIISTIHVYKIIFFFKTLKYLHHCTYRGFYRCYNRSCPPWTHCYTYRLRRYTVHDLDLTYTDIKFFIVSTNFCMFIMLLYHKEKKKIFNPKIIHFHSLS